MMANDCASTSNMCCPVSQENSSITNISLCGPPSKTEVPIEAAAYGSFTFTCPIPKAENAKFLSIQIGLGIMTFY